MNRSVPAHRRVRGGSRDASLPSAVEGDLHRFRTAEDIDSGESFVQLTQRSVRDVVKRTAERAAAETGDDVRQVSSHDLRRRYAQRLPVDEERVNPCVVLQVGGWSSFQAIEPHLNAPTPEVVDETFEASGLARRPTLGGEPDTP